MSLHCGIGDLEPEREEREVRDGRDGQDGRHERHERRYLMRSRSDKLEASAHSCSQWSGRQWKVKERHMIKAVVKAKERQRNQRKAGVNAIGCQAKAAMKAVEGQWQAVMKANNSPMQPMAGTAPTTIPTSSTSTTIGSGGE